MLLTSEAPSPDVLLTTAPKDDLVILSPLTPKGRQWLESYPPFDGEELALVSEYRPGLVQDAEAEGVTLTSADHPA